MNYQIHSRDYLRRARKELNKDTPQSLFYAAFELRCGIEARLQQYLDAQGHISRKMKKGWQIAALDRNIQKVFNTGDTIIEFAILDNKTEEVLDVFYYTPVNSKLKKMGEKLGNYLHAMKKYYNDDNPSWTDTRSFLEEAYLELQKANKGKILGVPLLHQNTQSITMSVEPDEGEENKSLFHRIGGPGNVKKIRVSYLDELPI